MARTWRHPVRAAQGHRAPGRAECEASTVTGAQRVCRGRIVYHSGCVASIAAEAREYCGGGAARAAAGSRQVWASARQVPADPDELQARGSSRQRHGCHFLVLPVMCKRWGVGEMLVGGNRLALSPSPGLVYTFPRDQASAFLASRLAVGCAAPAQPALRLLSYGSNTWVLVPPNDTMVVGRSSKCGTPQFDVPHSKN